MLELGKIYKVFACVKMDGSYQMAFVDVKLVDGIPHAVLWWNFQHEGPQVASVLVPLDPARLDARSLISSVGPCSARSIANTSNAGP